MNNWFFIYLFESSICLALFYIVYVLFLNKETHFQFNRIYILSAIFSSLVMPTIKFAAESFNQNISQPVEIIVLPISTGVRAIENTIEQNINYSALLWVIYLVGVILLSAKLLYQFIKLFIFIRNGEVVIKNRHYLICTNGQYPTSSFFKYILWDNTVEYSDEEIDKIIHHEKTHVSQLHSLDNLILELLQIIFWFNPFIYMYNKQLKEVHEYIADEQVLSKSKNYDVSDYEILINKQVLNNIGFQLSNNFNMSNLKNRIAMTTKQKSRKAAMLKALAVLPIAILIMVSFSYARQNSNTSNKGNETAATFKGGNEQLVKYMKENMKYPEAAKKEKAEGVVYVAFNIEPNGKVSSVKIAKSSGNRDLDNEAVRMVTTMPDWEPATKEGKKITSTFTLPIKFMDSPSIKLSGTYSGKNIFVQNPYVAKEGGAVFSVSKILINGVEQKNELNQAAIEIDLKHITVGEQVTIEIIHQSDKNSIQPKFLNPEVLK